MLSLCTPHCSGCNRRLFLFCLVGIDLVVAIIVALFFLWLLFRELLLRTKPKLSKICVVLLLKLLWKAGTTTSVQKLTVVHRKRDTKGQDMTTLRPRVVQIIFCISCMCCSALRTGCVAK